MSSIINATTTAGVSVAGDNSGSLQLATNNGTTAVTIDTSQNVGIGTSSPISKLDVNGKISLSGGASRVINYRSGDNDILYEFDAGDFYRQDITTSSHQFFTGNSERMRITSAGQILNGATSWGGSERALFQGAGIAGIAVNRTADDGGLVRFFQDGTQEGDISVSGTTVSYNGGHLSRYAQTTTAKDDSLLKGTVLSNLDEMNEYADVDGKQVENEQLNKVKVSDLEGDINVAGVFVNWSHDEAHNVDEINMAMTGDMIIRIAKDIVVQKGDLLMSAGNGTAKPQGDDIVRSKTIAKVTSNHVTCTYADGSYCVPCVLMAC